jgi:hypothetical protein
VKITQEEELAYKPLEGWLAEAMEQRDVGIPWEAQVRKHRRRKAEQLIQEIKDVGLDDLLYLIKEDPDRAIRMINTLMMALEAEYNPEVEY